MRLRHIEVFHAVMQAGSLSGAAGLLNISQPAASKMLAQAEHSLGVALFKRLPSGLKPTPEALLLFEETKTLHVSLDRVRQLARNLASHPGGMLRIGCIPSLGLSVVPHAVAAFTRQCPDVSVSFRTENQQTLSALLLAQEIDIGIAFEPTGMPGIAIAELGRARAVLFGARSEWGATDTVHLRDLDLARWIRLDAADPLGSRINAALAALDRDERAPKIEVKTYYLARALVENGVGFAVIDEYTAQSAGDAFAVRPLEPALSIGVCRMTSASAAGTRGLDVFVQLLEQHLGTQR